MKEKKCGKCGELKELSLFHLRTEPKKDGTRSYRSMCIECVQKQNLAYYFERGGKERQKVRAITSLFKKYGIMIAILPYFNHL
jgi:hypothetical protein